VRFFYDERHVERGTAPPGPVLSTRFGPGAVQTLDGQDHRVRKETFLCLLTNSEAAGDLIDRVGEAWRARPARTAAGRGWEALLRPLGPRQARGENQYRGEYQYEYQVPQHDLKIPLSRTPARVRNGLVMAAVRLPAPAHVNARAAG
jgi:hypothetical protein